MIAIRRLLRMLLYAANLGQALATGYLLLLTAAAWTTRRQTRLPEQPGARFLILIPAHNEERLLPELLASLARLDYRADMYAVHVIADNCTDQTAEVARQAGATVHVRSDSAARGKGYALNWGLARAQAAATHFDAVVILDADSLLAPGFLRVMDARLAQGERVIQGYYAVRDPGGSWSVGLRYAALAAVHYLRPLGRTALGGSAGLKGNGMVFAADLLQRHPWSGALTEDIEQHTTLLLAGERVTFAPDAIVWAEMPATLRAARSQHTRWERGRLEMARRYVPRLLDAGLRQRRFAPLDTVAELLMPPFSLLPASTLACLGLGRWLGLASRIPAVALAGQTLYVLSSLALVGAPVAAYRALCYAPLLIGWKLWLYGRVLLGRDQEGWVRTERNLK